MAIMVRLRALCVAALFVGTTATSSGSIAGHVHRHASAFKASRHASASHKHQVRLCNAFTKGKDGLSFQVNRHGKEVVDKHSAATDPIPYKSCKEVKLSLMAGDEIEFKEGDSRRGAFAVTALPTIKNPLLVLIACHKENGKGMTFKSHVFSPILNAQIASFDLNPGAAGKTKPSQLLIQDKKAEGKKDHGKHEETRSEKIDFSSVVALSAGNYELVLKGKNKKPGAKATLAAKDGMSYIVMRMPTADAGSKEELVVFPDTKPPAKSAARAAGVLPALLAALYAASLALSQVAAA